MLVSCWRKRNFFFRADSAEDICRDPALLCHLLRRGCPDCRIQLLTGDLHRVRDSEHSVFETRENPAAFSFQCRSRHLRLMENACVSLGRTPNGCCLICQSVPRWWRPRSVGTMVYGGEGRNRSPQRLFPPPKCLFSRANQAKSIWSRTCPT